MMIRNPKRKKANLTQKKNKAIMNRCHHWKRMKKRKRVKDKKMGSR